VKTALVCKEMHNDEFLCTLILFGGEICKSKGCGPVSALLVWYSINFMCPFDLLM
jgi:hypothetical protein